MMDGHPKMTLDEFRRQYDPEEALARLREQVRITPQYIAAARKWREWGPKGKGRVV